MKNIGNKITSMGESLKEFVGKYISNHKKPTTSEGTLGECPEINYDKHWYNETQVNQSFMG